MATLLYPVKPRAPRVKDFRRQRGASPCLPMLDWGVQETIVQKGEVAESRRGQIRLLALDIDGTLLNPQFQISAEDLLALRKTRAAGVVRCPLLS